VLTVPVCRCLGFSEYCRCVREKYETDRARVHEVRVSLHRVLMNVGGRSNLVTIFEYPRVAISLP